MIDTESVKAGVVVARWFGDEAARVYAMIGGTAETPEARERRELVRIITDHGGEITIRGLMQASRHYRTSAEEAEKALGRLVVADIVDVWEDNHDSCGGRPVLVFTLKESGNGNTTPITAEKSEVVLPLPPNGDRNTQVVPGSTPPSDEVCEWTG